MLTNRCFLLWFISFAANVNFIKSLERSCFTKPPDLPEFIPLYQQDFKNWAQTILVKNLWVAVPNSPSDIVTIVNWGKEKNYRIRPLGFMHNWSPLSITSSTDCTSTLMVDTKQHLTKATVIPASRSHYPFDVVTAETGLTIERLLTILEWHGFGLTASPAIGQVTLGGLFAIGGHGYGVRVANSTSHLKQYGSVVDRIVNIQAVVWSTEENRYTLQTFDRSTCEASALMTHLGLAFITSMTLRVDGNYMLRCVSRTDIPNREIFASPSLDKKITTFASLLEETGKVTVISYPYADNSWIISCTEVASCPQESRVVHTPYNYPFAQQLPEFVSDLFQEIMTGVTIVTPAMAHLIVAITELELARANSNDICGLSKNSLLYVGSQTLWYNALSWTILSERRNIQQVISMVKRKLDDTLNMYADDLSFPMNGPLEIRVTELDSPGDIAPNARYSFLADTTPIKQNPKFDSVIWIELLTLPGTQDSDTFFIEMENYFINTFNGDLGYSRPEWSKSWGYTKAGGNTNITVMRDIIANRFDDWDAFISVINRLDPHNIFGNQFLDQLFVSRNNGISYDC